MIGQPLSNRLQNKLLILLLRLAPYVLILFFVPVVPAIFLSFGIFMENKNTGFSNIEIAVKNFKAYMSFVLTMLLLMFFVNSDEGDMSARKKTLKTKAESAQHKNDN